MKAESYDYDMSGGYADTVATLDDGRTCWINTQYGTVNVRHDAECAISQQRSCGPTPDCTCDSDLSDKDKAAMIIDARLNGKFGSRPVDRRADPVYDAPRKRGPGWCDACQSYCYGDCQA